MKNKYSAIIKVKKQGLDRAEMVLIKAKSKANEAKAKMEDARRLYHEMGVSTGGVMRAIKADLQLKEIARQDMLYAREDELVALREVSHKQALYKQALMDFEKMKYLEMEEFKKHKAHLLKEEAKFLDEIAISRHFKGKDE